MKRAHHVKAHAGVAGINYYARSAGRRHWGIDIVVRRVCGCCEDSHTKWIHIDPRTRKLKKWPRTWSPAARDSLERQIVAEMVERGMIQAPRRRRS